MAEACTITEQLHTTIKVVKWSWTSAVGGAVGAAAVNSVTTNVIDGVVIACQTIPAAAGDAPDANYDVTITDHNSVDILNGMGANRAAAATETLVAGYTTSGLLAASGVLKLNVTNAGDGNMGTVYLWVR
jgi:hypothetical protein